MTNVLSNETLIKQMNAILKAGNNVTLREDNARAFFLDAVATAGTIGKLFVHFAKSGTGSLDKLGVKKRTLKKHLGINTEDTGTDIKEEDTVPFSLVPVYLDTWIENSNTFYTARTRGQDVRQALLSLMQAQYAADLQDLAFNGDESSSDVFVKLNDGYIKMAKASAEVKVEGAKLPTIQELTAATARIEPKYLRQGTFKFFMSQATATNYVVELQNRNTALGDAVLVDGALRNIGGFGVEVVESMENNVILFTPYENLAVVSGLTVTLTTAAQDSRSVAKQATYHFMLDDIDFIIREPKALAYFGIDATPEG
ncbi:hypothetical protein IGK30_000305 [Enterococcus sp. AZ178]|uniref:phage capsid protein n=1 Tax=Enterococcus sp. AZ178 TaxID=2774822 RepID=UPI003F278F75